MRVLQGLLGAIVSMGMAVSGAMAGSVSGVVVDQDQAPVAGIHVEAVYQTYRGDHLNNAGESIKAETVTGSDGRYEIDLSRLPPGEYAVSAYQASSNGGQGIDVALSADNPETFAGNAVTVRNFTAGLIEYSEEFPYGNAGVFVLNNAIMDYTDLSAAEVTLTNVETGQTLVKAVRGSGEGLVATGIPFGTYEVSVALAGEPLQVSLWGPGYTDAFGASVTHDFTMGYLHNQLQVAARP